MGRACVLLGVQYQAALLPAKLGPDRIYIALLAEAADVCHADTFKIAASPCTSLGRQVAEAALTDVRVEGSLMVHADCALGAMEAVPDAGAPRAPPVGDLHVHHLNGRTQVKFSSRGLSWWSWCLSCWPARERRVTTACFLGPEGAAGDIGFITYPLETSAALMACLTARDIVQQNCAGATVCCLVPCTPDPDSADGHMQVLPIPVGVEGLGSGAATKPWAPGMPAAPDERLVFSQRCAPASA